MGVCCSAVFTGVPLDFADLDHFDHSSSTALMRRFIGLCVDLIKMAPLIRYGIYVMAKSISRFAKRLE
jgi:hypothetical protein